MQIRFLLALAPFAFAAVAHANPTLPPRKPGLWQTAISMRMVVNGQPMHGAPAGMMVATCIDPMTDLKQMQRVGTEHGNCGKPQFTGSGGSYVMTNSCKTPSGGVMTMHGTMVYERDTALHIEVTMKSDTMTGTMVQDSKWVGACPAGVAPGDIGMMVNGGFRRISNVDTPAH